MLGRMMLGGFEDGTKVQAEPLVEKDVVINTTTQSAIVHVKFATLVRRGRTISARQIKTHRDLDNPNPNLLFSSLFFASLFFSSLLFSSVFFCCLLFSLLSFPTLPRAMNQPPQDTSESASHDNNEFDELRRALAETADSAQDADPIALSLQLARDRRVSSAPVPKKRRLKKKACNVRRKAHKRAKKGSPDYTFQQFVKASRYARGAGASAIHPSAKLRLFGLLMQAQKGDCPTVDSPFIAASLTNSRGGSSTALQHLKLKAWAAVRGTGQIEAMKKYLELLTSIAPTWKVASLITGRDDESKPQAKNMMWVLKISCKLRE